MHGERARAIRYILVYLPLASFFLLHAMQVVYFAERCPFSEFHDLCHIDEIIQHFLPTPSSLDHMCLFEKYSPLALQVYTFALFPGRSLPKSLNNFRE